MLDIAITGMGVVSPIGIGVQEFWESLREGKSGACIRECFADSRNPLRIAAPVTDFDGKKYVKPRKSIKVMCRPIQFGFAASSMALAQAKVDEFDFDPERKGTVFGAEAFHANPIEVVDVFRKCVDNFKYVHDLWGEEAMRQIEPLWMLKYLPNMVASHVSISFDARGPSNSICQGEVSSSLAVIEAIDLIERGSVDVIVAGGTGAPMDITGLLYRDAHRMTKRIDSPETASRPFDKDRDGMVFGEGAGAIVLEKAAAARERGAEVLATIVGMTRTFCPRSTCDFSDAIAGAIDKTMKQANLTAADIGHVNAVGLSTLADDRSEAIGITKILGDCPVFAPKSYYGYIGPGADIVDLVASVAGLKNEILPRTLNFASCEDGVAVCVNRETMQVENKTFLALGFSPTGQITCLAVEV
jgi:3-oxoacyl-[acyl-carrier-protein] synthase II